MSDSSWNLPRESRVFFSKKKFLEVALCFRCFIHSRQKFIGNYVVEDTFNYYYFDNILWVNNRCDFPSEQPDKNLPKRYCRINTPLTSSAWIDALIFPTNNREKNHSDVHGGVISPHTKLFAKEEGPQGKSHFSIENRNVRWHAGRRWGEKSRVMGSQIHMPQIILIFSATKYYKLMTCSFDEFDSNSRRDSIGKPLFSHHPLSKSKPWFFHRIFMKILLRRS